MSLAPIMAQAPTPEVGSLDLVQIFLGSPLIYSLLLILSLMSVSLWIYTLLTLRPRELMPNAFLIEVREMINDKRFDAALSVCQQQSHFSANVIGSALAARKHGPQVMMDALHAEGRRQGLSLWQRIALLNEIAVVAPMLGLLGTVVGLFIAFYGMNRSAESLAAIFDGFGMAVGTTVAGLIVAIMAMIFYTTLKFRVVQLLNTVENESLAVLSLVEHETRS